MRDWALKKSAYLVVSALILHDVPEGFAMANAYLASPEVGVLVALAIAPHNLPEEFAMAVPAVTIRSKQFLFSAALLSALAERLGAIIGLAAVCLAPSLHAHFLAFAAGAMLFVSIRELIPMAKRYQHLGWFVGGVNEDRALGPLLYHGLIAFRSDCLAVVAERTHNVFDLAAAVAVLIGLKLADRKLKFFPYGLYKVENLVAAGLAGMVFLTKYEIARDALMAEEHASAGRNLDARRADRNGPTSTRLQPL